MADPSDFLERVIDLLERNGIRYCVFVGQAVNAYEERSLHNWNLNPF